MVGHATLRAWWHHRQGLDGHLAGVPAAEVLVHTGWASTVGGSAPYLTLFARAGTARAEVDKAVGAQEICELPSARGCTYVLSSRCVVDPRRGALHSLLNDWMIVWPSEPVPTTNR